MDFINADIIKKDDKERLMMNVTVYRDFAIYFEGDKFTDSKSDEEGDPGKRNRAYWLSRCALGDTSWDYCVDCCMREGWEDFNITEYTACIVSGVVPCIIWRLISCSEDCSRTGEEASKSK